ncbi:pirin family protein [Nitrosomonas sp.]|uniref:pirin family protein n=1 Tax=Nitrosomonas sp. TaxID=42353 RepID=UPI002845C9B7|nr:pirin family protein [Nitrosomonas sp.]MDR4515527.1 pirin family protein [Nitrosomonas sp.]
MNASANTVYQIPAIETREGAGVTVYRTIGTPQLRNFDPFLLLDHIDSDNPKNYIAGFPSHPHRGFTTLTYILDGQMTHQDSLGNSGDLGPGSVQWMKAASGVIHSEMPKQKDGLLRGFQLWVNLPAAHKMDRPEYQEYAASAFPVIRTPTYTIKVLVGSYDDTTGPIKDNITSMSFLDVQLRPRARFQITSPVTHNRFLYLFEGDGTFEGDSVASHSLIIPDADDNLVDFTASEQGARFLIAHAQPINEPIARQGPFVMNSRAEIEQAARDYQSNQLVREAALHRHGK